ncbi:10c18e08-dcc0-4c06-a1b0-e8d73c247778 [Thermothielavioides terrestris]|uniref:10c18e08-dcc0-4c06-a1b0-e8d73c247778 n=1 Tax=Thermothielavioides terrestris TaxID=2587410 RepID=A0A3S4AVS7_9PEZI|nr:10c18e08-dcc0-4c06-a1b0-e8d73c247778 [Thermothielavioides terrestris]
MATTGKLPMRQLGKNGPLVPRIGLGLMGLSSAHGVPKPDEERLAFLDKAYEMGETFWDTGKFKFLCSLSPPPDMYHDSEDLLGKWFAANPEKRGHIFLATKFGYRRTAAGEHSIDTSAGYCAEALERSLARLGVAYVDLYYPHRLDKATPIEKTMAALAALKRAGKIRHIGLSECSAAALRRAHAVEPVACVQLEYSAFSLDIEVADPRHGALLATARELGVAVVAYSPLGKGLLGGAIRSVADVSRPGDLRARFAPRFAEENIAANVALVDKLTEIAARKGVTTAQLALAWLLAQGDDIFPIPGTRTPERLAENLAALHVTLTGEEEKAIRQLADKVAGSRLGGILTEYYFGDSPQLDS